MKKTRTIILVTIAITLLVLLPGCRTKKTPAPVAQPTVVESQPPQILPPPPQDTTVREPEDFVQTPEPTEETFPADIEQLNRYVQERGYVRDAFFSYDASTLDDAAQSALSSSATWLKSREGVGYSLLIEGHCDERGTEQYNLALGDRRANTAKEYLMTLGVDSRRIRTVSYGEERPFEEGSSEAVMSQNRRAHLVLVR